MTAIAWSMISNGMLAMEHAEPWKVFHDHARIMESLPCCIDPSNAAIIYLQDGKPIMASIVGYETELYPEFGIDYLAI